VKRALPVRLALGAIRAYQRWLSPRKGFSCAFRSATGGASCSAYGYQVIERFGLRPGLGLLQRRLDLCGHVHGATRPPRHPVLYKQQGHCDLSCDGPGDLGCAGHHTAATDAADCACSALNSCGDCGFGNDCGGDSCRRFRRGSRPMQRTGKRSSQHLDALAERVRRQQESKRSKANRQAHDDEV
jgi:putative component of membrane protein insertase Oxa1/YidC/SpoIIIJ protein YidD